MGVYQSASMLAVIKHHHDNDTEVEIVVPGAIYRGFFTDISRDFSMAWFQVHRSPLKARMTGLPQRPVGKPIAVRIDSIAAVQEMEL